MSSIILFYYNIQNIFTNTYIQYFTFSSGIQNLNNNKSNLLKFNWSINSSGNLFVSDIPDKRAISQNFVNFSIKSTTESGFQS